MQRTHISSAIRPAERRAHQHHILKILPIEQVEIEIREIVDGTKPVGPLGRAETRVPRHNHPPVPRQFLDELPVLLEIVATMQKKQWRTFSRHQHFERNLTDCDALHPISLRPLRRNS
jgi:hypothetical protein